ncbi:unnamed protein product, partial [Polarella glacialis]
TKSFPSSAGMWFSDPFYELSALEAGCAPLRRPPLSVLFGIAVLAFCISAAIAALPEVFNVWSGRFANTPSSARWRARATLATLHQPIGVVVLLSPMDAITLFFRAIRSYGRRGWT